MFYLYSPECKSVKSQKYHETRSYLQEQEKYIIEIKMKIDNDRNVHNIESAFYVTVAIECAVNALKRCY